MYLIIEILLIILGIITIIVSSVRVLREYERGVIFRLGRLHKIKGPGLIFIIPFVDKMIKVDLRLVSIDVPRQEIITKDNVSVIVDAVVYFRITEPVSALIKVENYYQSTFLIAQTTLRSVLGESDLDELLSQRDKINKKLQEVIDKQTGSWGISVPLVEIKEISLPEGLKQAMARQAEAERERRAKIINAEGECQSAEKLVQAANILSSNPISFQLRYLNTIFEVSSHPNTTILFPFPVEVISSILKKLSNKD